jgi:hypothetical protein
MQGAPGRVALGDPHQLLERQGLQLRATDQGLHAVKAHALVVQEVKQQRVARQHRLEIREVVGNLR